MKNVSVEAEANFGVPKRPFLFTIPGIATYAILMTAFMLIVGRPFWYSISTVLVVLAAFLAWDWFKTTSHFTPLIHKLAYFGFATMCLVSGVAGVLTPNWGAILLIPAVLFYYRGYRML